MSEGFAAYCEQLYLEHFRGASDAQAHRTGVFNRVMGKAGGSVYVDDTTNVYRIFESRLTYDKGAAVAHMLRHIAPDDSTFFNALKTYQQQYAYRTATTADFQAIIEAAYGRPLDTFFNQWIYGQGFPTYTASWNQLGSDVFVKLAQTTSVPSSVPVFAMPVTLRLTSATDDTLVKVYFDTTEQIYHFGWGRAMTNAVIDPNNDILNHVQPVIHDHTLTVTAVAVDNVRIYPNPAGHSWQVSGIVPGASLQLSDAMGKVVWQLSNAPGSLSIDSSTLAPGVYTLVIRQSKSRVITRVLQKR
jgi:hypothetical protein